MTPFEASKILDDFITLPEVFSFYGYEANRANFVCCPFHSEKTPSCKVNKFQFNCFGCGAKGNAVSFVKQLFNTDFNTAIQKINDDFGLRLLDSELSHEQRQKIRQRRIQVYEQKQINQELESIKQEYYDAWKHYVIYKPEEKNYNIDTPEYLVDEYLSTIDSRFLQAIETIDRLSDYALINNFYIDEFDAICMFTL